MEALSLGSRKPCSRTNRSSGLARPGSPQLLWCRQQFWTWIRSRGWTVDFVEVAVIRWLPPAPHACGR